MPLYNPPGAAGSGDVVGPASSVDSEIALYSGVTGKLIKRASGTGIARTASGVFSTAELSGDVTTSGSNATTIANNAVTYAKMQDIAATARFLGRITSGAGDTEELTGTQATTLLDAFTSGLKGLVPASGGGTTNFLRADATFAAPSAGSIIYFEDQLSYDTSSAEQDILSGTVTGGDLSTDKGVFFFIYGHLLSNSGVNNSTVRLKYGATTLFGDVGPNWTNNANRHSFVLFGGIFNNGATNAQVGMLIGSFGVITAGSVAGFGDFATGTTWQQFGILGQGTATEDSTANKTLAITHQFSVSNAANAVASKGFAILI